MFGNRTVKVLQSGNSVTKKIVEICVKSAKKNGNRSFAFTKERSVETRGSTEEKETTVVRLEEEIGLEKNVLREKLPERKNEFYRIVA